MRRAISPRLAMSSRWNTRGNLVRGLARSQHPLVRGAGSGHALEREAMKVLKVYLRLYADCFRKAFAAIGKNAWTLLLPVAVSFAVHYAGLLAARLGVLAGILMTLATAALFSSYLYFVRELVLSARVSLKELRNSIGAFFWSIMNVFFVIWIASWVLTLLVGRTPNAGALL